MTTSNAQHCRDWFIVETVLLPSPFIKTAEGGLVSSIISSIKNYVASKIDPNNKVASIIDILTPGILFSVSPMLGILMKVAQSVFGLDPGKMLTDAVSNLVPFLHANEKLSSDEVNAHAKQAVFANAGQLATTQDKTSSLRDIQLFRLALDQCVNGNIKQASFFTNSARFFGVKLVTANLLSTVIGWILKVVLASAGFMVAGDIIHTLIGKATDSVPGSSTTSTEPSTSTQPTPISHQHILKVNPNYAEEELNVSGGWIEPVPPSQIGDRLVKWTQAIYPDPRLTPELIKASIAFQSMVELIQKYNTNNTSNVTFMPKGLTSYKQVVDNFIDDVAEHLPKSASSAENRWLKTGEESMSVQDAVELLLLLNVYGKHEDRDEGKRFLASLSPEVRDQLFYPETIGAHPDLPSTLVGIMNQTNFFNQVWKTVIQHPSFYPQYSDNMRKSIVFAMTNRGIGLLSGLMMNDSDNVLKLTKAIMNDEAISQTDKDYWKERLGTNYTFSRILRYWDDLMKDKRSDLP